MPTPHGLCQVRLLYAEKKSSSALLLEGERHLLRLLQEIPQGESEQVAVEEGITAYESLLAKLADVLPLREDAATDWSWIGANHVTPTRPNLIGRGEPRK